MRKPVEGSRDGENSRSVGSSRRARLSGSLPGLLTNSAPAGEPARCGSSHRHGKQCWTRRCRVHKRAGGGDEASAAFTRRDIETASERRATPRERAGSVARSACRPAETATRWQSAADRPMPPTPPHRASTRSTCTHPPRDRGGTMVRMRRAPGRRQGASGHPEAFRGPHVPARPRARGRGARPARQFDHRLRLRRHELGVVWPDLPGTRARRFRYPQLRVGPVEPVHVSDTCLRSGSSARRTCRAWRKAKGSAALA